MRKGNNLNGPVFSCCPFTIWPTIEILKGNCLHRNCGSPGKRRMHTLVRFPFESGSPLPSFYAWSVTDKRRKSGLLTCGFVCISLHSAYFQLEYVMIGW